MRGKPAALKSEQHCPISSTSKLKFEEFLKTTSKVKQTAELRDMSGSSQNKHNSSEEKEMKIGKENILVALPPPCVHLNGCGPNSMKTGRTFKSLENIHISDDSSAVRCNLKLIVLRLRLLRYSILRLTCIFAGKVHATSTLTTKVFLR